MNSYLLNTDDLRLATSWGHHRTRSILTKPFALPFQKAKAGPSGGPPKRLYRLDDILVRCRQKISFNEVNEQKLIFINQQKRKLKETL